MIITNTITKEIPFYDLDPMAVVWHGNYVKYLEEARCALLARLGYTYEDMHQDGVAYPIAKMELKYIKPCIFGQKINITATLKEYESCMIVDYEIKDFETNEKIFKAKSMQIPVCIKTKETLYSPSKKLLEAVKNYA